MGLRLVSQEPRDSQHSTSKTCRSPSAPGWPTCVHAIASHATGARRKDWARERSWCPLSVPTALCADKVLCCASWEKRNTLSFWAQLQDYQAWHGRVELELNDSHTLITGMIICVLQMREPGFAEADWWAARHLLTRGRVSGAQELGSECPFLLL